MEAVEELSTETETSFVTSLQELKNLKPHLYSAAEYGEKTYINSEQKQMILDNLKDYALRALVNSIDHLGTVAYKLNEIVEQQTLEISSIDMKVACLNQKLLTCQTYTDSEGLRQQQLLAIVPRHHKHYTLPNSVKRKVHFSPHMQSDLKQRLHTSGALAARTLSWHLASETKSTFKAPPRGIMSTEEPKINGKTSGVLDSSGAKRNSRRRSTPATRVAMQTLGVTRRVIDSSEGSKPSSDPHTSQKKNAAGTPIRNKNMFSAFFARHKRDQT